jgi:hypothetical protein
MRSLGRQGLKAKNGKAKSENEEEVGRGRSKRKAGKRESGK